MSAKNKIVNAKLLTEQLEQKQSKKHEHCKESNDKINENQQSTYSTKQC